MTKSTRTIAAATTAILSVGVLAGCATVEYSPALRPCSPEYAAPSAYGRFSASQAHRGAPILCGAYPNAAYQGNHYYVRVYAGGRVVDTKNQYYAPHGSLNAGTALKYSGQKFALIGTVSRDGKLVLNFDLQCKIA